MKIICLALLLIGSLPLLAYDGDQGHQEAAATFYDLVSPREVFIESFREVFNTQLTQMSKMGVSEDKIDRIREAAMDYAQKIAADPDMKQRMVNAYMESFTERELRELIAFYQTPLGHKALNAMPELYAKGTTIGQELALKHQKGFQRKIESILTDEGGDSDTETSAEDHVNADKEASETAAAAGD